MLLIFLLVSYMLSAYLISPLHCLLPWGTLLNHLESVQLTAQWGSVLDLSIDITRRK